MNTLDKIQDVNAFLRKNVGRITYKRMCSFVAGLIESDAYIVDSNNDVVAFDVQENPECSVYEKKLNIRNGSFTINSESLTSDDVVILELSSEECMFFTKCRCDKEKKTIMTLPINNKQGLVATVVLVRVDNGFGEEDILLGQVVSTVFSLEFLYRELDKVKIESQKTDVVEKALDALSYSEIEAAKHIINELNDLEGFLVASKIADKVGITRSVIVNALRKLESAGVIESRSLGMKGTYIKILNEKLLDQLNIDL